MQPGEYCRVNAICFDLGLSDYAHLQRVRDDDTARIRLEQPHDGHRIASRLENHLVIPAKRACELKNLVADQIQAPPLAQHAIRQLRNLCEASMHVQPNHPHRLPPSLSGAGEGNTTCTDPRSQRTRVGRRGGQLLTRARSS
jgi:hypothetical protein